MGGQRHAPAALPPRKTRYPLIRKLGWHQSRSGLVREISPTPGFDPPTLQPVARRYPGPPLSQYEHRYTKLTDLHFRYRPHSRTLTHSLQILRSGLFILIPNRIQVHIGKEIILVLEAIIVCHVVVNSLHLCRIYKIPCPPGSFVYSPCLNY